jgi:hypothetical protein
VKETKRSGGKLLSNRQLVAQDKQGEFQNCEDDGGMAGLEEMESMESLSEGSVKRMKKKKKKNNKFAADVSAAKDLPLVDVEDDSEEISAERAKKKKKTSEKASSKLSGVKNQLSSSSKETG